MMSEVEETPPVRCSKPLAIFYGHIHAVEFAVEIAPTGWFGARTVGKARIENASQFLDEDGPFGEGTGFEINVQVFLFDVDVVVFGEACFAVVEAIGRQRSADKDPVTITLWPFQLSIPIKYGRRLRSGVCNPACVVGQ